MTNKSIIRLAVIVAAATTTICVSHLFASPRPSQDPTAQCAIVPKGWGDYIGAGSYGLEFKDESGIIRFVKQFPCGLEGAPTVSLEVRRK